MSVRPQLRMLRATSGYQPGDKVRIKVGVSVGQRGFVVTVGKKAVVVRVADDKTVSVPADSLTNFSLAARRAWAVMPKRAGRPKLTEGTKRMVSIRIDAEVWLGLEEMVRQGRIESREKAVNDWLRRGLSRLRAQAFRSSERAPNASARAADRSEA